MALALAGSATQAATFLEQGGRVVIEAEHFDSRTANSDGHQWQVIPNEPGATKHTPAFTFTNPRGGAYLQTLPDSLGAGQNRNQPGDEAGPPAALYKVKITTPGNYRLWLKWGGYDGASDSMYAAITEVSSPGWYRYVQTIGPDLASAAWQGTAAPDNNGGGGDEVPAVYNNLAAGTYTIRLTQREDGSAVDAIILQLASLPDPTGIGPAESQTEGNTIPVVAPTIVSQPVDTTAAIGTSGTFSIGVSNNIVPASIRWFRNNVEIIGANDLTFRTPSLTAADNLAQYYAILSSSAGSATSTVVTLHVVENLLTTGRLKYEYFPGQTRPPVVAGTAGNPSFTGNTVGSDRSGFHTIFESGVNFADNYANKFSGLFIPPTTGNYVFYVSADDDTDLFLSTDENPANKKLIAREVSWSNNRQWNSPGGGTSTIEDKRSDQFTASEWTPPNQIRLEAGRRYYIEGVHHEGGGGDAFGATYRLESEDETLTDNGTPSRLTGSVIGVLIPQIIELGGVNVGFKTLSFSVTDVGPSLLDPTKTKVTFDGQPVTMVASAKDTNGVTRFTYNYPARLVPGSTHSYSVEVRDSAGRPATASGTVTMSMPWFPSADLKGPAPVNGKWASRFIFGMTNPDGSVIQQTGLANIISRINQVGTPAFTGEFVDTTVDVINWAGGGRFGNNLPYPDDVTAGGGCCTDDFINLNIGHIVIPEDGDYTFGVHSDDGFAMRIRGGEAISIDGGGQIDLADPETIVHPADTGDSNTRAVYRLRKGVYRIEFFWWERGGGDNAELYAAKGAFTTDASTSTWRLIGDPAPSVELTLLGVDANGWTVLSSDPGGEQLGAWDVANADLTATGGGAKNYDALNVGDPDTNAGTDPFPKNRTGTDDDDFALKATATLVVPETGTYLLGFNSDDGAYLKLTGRTFLEIQQNNTALSAISGDTVTCDCLTGDSGTTATVQLQQGTYQIEAGMFERGGGAFLRVSGAKLPASGTVSSGELPTLAKGMAGTKVNTPSSLKLTNAPTGVDPSGQPPRITVTRSGTQLTITSDSGGTVEASPTISPATWTALGTAPQNVPITGNASYFRIRK